MVKRKRGKGATTVFSYIFDAVEPTLGSASAPNIKTDHDEDTTMTAAELPIPQQPSLIPKPAPLYDDDQEPEDWTYLDEPAPDQPPEEININIAATKDKTPVSSNVCLL